MDPREAFQILQPASIAVARDHSVDSVRALCHAVEQVLAAEKNSQIDGGSNCISQMKEYLVFPLFIVLKSGKKLSWTMQEELVRCLLIVLRQSSIDDFSFFQNIFTELFILLTNKSDPQKGNNLSEECKQLVLTTITTVIHNSTEKVLEKIISNDFRPQLGHAVFICLKLAQEEKNRSLRIEAIVCLSALGQKKFFTNISEAKQDNLSSTFTNFLPGIVTGLAKIANGDEKQGHKITCAAIDAWVYFVVLVMRDDFLKEKVSNLEENETVSELRNKLFKVENLNNKTKTSTEKKNKFYIPGPDEETSLKLPSVDINRKWIHETAGKLIILIQSMIKLVSHPHWKVRLSLIQFAEKLICSCHRSLTGAVVLALQLIITLRSDDIVDVGTSAQNSLLSVMNVIGYENRRSSIQKGMYELLEEHVYALCTQLPTIFKQDDNSKTLSSVRQLLGCLEVLGGRISQLMTWPTHSLRLLRSLRYGLALDVGDSDLLLERTSAEDPFSVLTIKPSLGRSFKYFQDVRIFESIASSCKLIGYHCDITVVSDLCLELLQESQSRKEALIVFTLILQGRDKSKCKDTDGDSMSLAENEKVVQSILDVLISLEIFDVPLSVIGNASVRIQEDQIIVDTLVPVNRQENISVDMVKSNIVLVANALNLISAASLMIGKDFEMFLSTILCSVMEKAGESNVLVSFTGHNTLTAIAKACKYGDVAQLIEKSVHHYWYPLSMKLKRLLQYPSAPLVLQVCLEYANVDVIAFTEELVQDVLISLDSYHSEQALPLLRVLLVYIMAVIRYEAKSTITEVHVGREVKSIEEGGSVSVTVDENSKSEGLAFFLRDYHAKQLQVKENLEKEEKEEPLEEEDIARGFSKGEGENKGDDAIDEVSQPDENKTEAPVYVKHVVEVLEKCSHLLYVQDRKLKLLILEVIRAGSDALAKWENERLPVFHKLWKPLVLRLKDVDFIVMMRSFDVLTVMAVSSGDFLRRRIIKEIFPVIFSFLKSQGSVSLSKTKDSGYYMTTAYRAQYSVLKHLPNLLKALNLGVLETSELLNVMMIYLDTRQPQKLLDFAIVVVKEVVKTHPQHVWLVLAYQQPPVRILPPSPCLGAVHIKSMPQVQLPDEIVELYRQLS
ncbi:TELO2-interacting protein 1 homolog [Macrobrachium nipponense]|uniref:TELO2-interacting protein 1 homolog n=1 Tax=Macrobrachium nipponense TaxID=159736 RepID=UPI0030C87661